MVKTKTQQIKIRSIKEFDERYLPQATAAGRFGRAKQQDNGTWLAAEFIREFEKEMKKTPRKKTVRKR